MQILLIILGVLLLLTGFLSGKVRKFETPELSKNVRGGLVFVGGLLVLLCLANSDVFEHFSLGKSQKPPDVSARFSDITPNTTDLSNDFTTENPLDRTPSPVPNAASGSYQATTNSELASIKFPENFVTCNKVDQRNPELINDVFSYGEVYAWARVHAPREEVLTLKWFAADNRLLKSKRILVGKNMGSGYRIYDFKQFNPGDDGVYELKLYNSSQELIGTRQFRIDGEYAGR